MTARHISSSSREKKLQDGLNYSTSIVDELVQDDYYLFLSFKILKKTHFRGYFYVQNAISQQLILQMIKKLEWVLETNLQFPVIFKTGKETFILRGNVQNQSKNKERACLK